MLLFRGLMKRDVFAPEKGWLRLWFAVIVACMVMGAVLFFMTHDIEAWRQASVALRIKKLALSICFGVLLYVFTCMVAGLKTHHLVRGAK